VNDKLLLELIEGQVDEEAWREIAAASPSSFYYWANAFKELQTEKILSGCRKNYEFRNSYSGSRKYISKYIEEYDVIVPDDYRCTEAIPVLRDEKTAADVAGDCPAGWFPRRLENGPLVHGPATPECSHRPGRHCYKVGEYRCRWGAGFWWAPPCACGLDLLDG